MYLVLTLPSSEVLLLEELYEYLHCVQLYNDDCENVVFVVLYACVFVISGCNVLGLNVIVCIYLRI